MIRLEKVNKIFCGKSNEVHALKDVSIQIKEGEIFGIIGFSGAGKSTLIRCINRLETPSSGSVWIDGQDITKLKEKQLREVRKKIGMIFQHFHLMQSRTVYQNIAFPLKHANLTKEEKDKKIQGLLKLIDLEDKKDSYPSQLSGGQKQRVAIARALASDPTILLCDEATSALDPQTTKSILQLLKKVNEELKITIVLITHEMAVIKEICDRVAIMEHGVIKEQGKVLEVFANPKEQITKDFLSHTSNLSLIYDMIQEHHPLVTLKPHQSLIRLCYDTSSTDKPLISEIARKFDVDISIIFGNVELIQGSPLGDMVVIMEAKDASIEQALQYLQKHGVKVEVLKQC